MKVWFSISTEFSRPDPRVTRFPDGSTTLSAGHTRYAWNAGTVNVTGEITMSAVFDHALKSVLDSVAPQGFTKDHMKLISFDARPDAIGFEPTPADLISLNDAADAARKDG